MYNEGENKQVSIMYKLRCAVLSVAWHRIYLKYKNDRRTKVFPAALPLGAAVLALDHLSPRLPRGRRLPGTGTPQIQPRSRTSSAA